MKSAIALVCCLFLSAIGQSQDIISIEDFLKASATQETVTSQERKYDLLMEAPDKLSAIEKLEFRTETNDFDLRKQEYTFRASPNSRYSIKSQRQYLDALKLLTKIELNVASGDALFDRYNLLADYIYYKDILKAKLKLKDLLEDRVTLLKRSISLAKFDVIDLIDAEDEVVQNYHDILELQNVIVTYDKLFQRKQAEEVPVLIETFELIRVEEINILLAQLHETETGNHPMLEVLSAKKYNSMLEYEWKQSDTKFALGYVQAKYGNDLNGDFRNHFSLGLGFDIPLKRSPNLSMNELQMKIFEHETKFYITRNEYLDHTYSLYHKLDNLIKKYNLMLDNQNNSQAEFALKEYSKIAESTPMAMLKLKDNTLNKQIKLVELRHEILQNYLSYLYFSGRLFEAPSKNYLSKKLKSF